MKVFSLGLAICAALAVTTELVAAGSTICATPDDFVDTGASSAVASSTGSQTTADTSAGDNQGASSISSDEDDVQGSASSTGSGVEGSVDSTGSDSTTTQADNQYDVTSTSTSVDGGDAQEITTNSPTKEDNADSAVDSAGASTSTSSGGDDTTQNGSDDQTTSSKGDASDVNGSRASSSVGGATGSQSSTADVNVGSDSASASAATTPSSTPSSTAGGKTGIDTGSKTGIMIDSTSQSVTSSNSGSSAVNTPSVASSTTSSDAGQSVIQDSATGSNGSSTTSSASTTGSLSPVAQVSTSASGSAAAGSSASTSGPNVSLSASGSNAAHASASASTTASASGSITSSSSSSSLSSSSSSSSSTSGSFSKVTSLQVRVQGDMPEWNEANQRFVSSYYDTFDEKYRAVLDTVNMASVEGALKYVQAECINSSAVTDCERKNNIKYVVFYQTTIVQPAASMDYYANGTDEYDYAVEHCPFMAMDGGQCDPNDDGTFPDICNQYIGADGQPDLGFCVGGTLQDNEVIAPYPHNYWFSFPNSCPQELWDDKTASCREEYAGGMCALGVEPDGVNCTFSYEILGYILLDDVVGITKMINPLTLTYYTDYYEFCEAGGIEFAVSILGDLVSWIIGLPFWANPGDSDANAERVEKLVSAYDTLVSTNATTSDGGIMKSLPTVDALKALNPPCYDNSALCAESEFGCKRSYRSQICQVCTSADSDCDVKP